MGVGWIDNLANNTGSTWQLQSVDDSHNGSLKGGGNQFQLDDKNFHALQPKTIYSADWCGIPWYFQGKHYKTLAGNAGGASGLRFFTSNEEDGKNYIVFINAATLVPVARQVAPDQDFHCTLRIEDNGVFVDIYGVDFTGDVMSKTADGVQKWVSAVLDDVSKVLKMVAGG